MITCIIIKTYCKPLLQVQTLRIVLIARTRRAHDMPTALWKTHSTAITSRSEVSSDYKYQ